MSAEQLVIKALDAIDKKGDLLIDVARFLWDNPELGYQEVKASKLLKERLIEAGFQVEDQLGGLSTAFKAVKQGQALRPSLAFFAEYDALPGLGHGCGHNLFAAAALGAAFGVGEVIEELEGSVVVVGTPAEEGVVPKAGGKIRLLERGALAGLDVAIVAHADDQTVVEKSLLARQTVNLHFKGCPAHAGGAPERGKNALNAATLAWEAINGLRQFIPPNARIHGIIAKGGEMVNTVPDVGAIHLGIRAPTTSLLERIVKRVLDCAQAGAIATGCDWRVDYPTPVYKHMMNNSELGALFYRALQRLGVSAVWKDEASYSTDMGNVSHEIPSFHPYIKIGPAGLVGHTPEFAAAACSKDGFAGMLIGAKAMALTAIYYYRSLEIQGRVKREFMRAQREGLMG